MYKDKKSLDLFWLLEQLDKKNLHIWKDLSEAQQKEFSTFMTLKWMRCTSNEHQLNFLNELANPIVFNSDKQFFMKILAICSFGGKKRYSWLPSYKKSNESEKIQIISSYYKISNKEAKDYLKFYSNEDYIELAELLGYQKEEIQKLKKSFK